MSGRKISDENKKLTPARLEILNDIRDLVEEYGTPVTNAEIAQAVSKSRQYINQLLRIFVAQGLVTPGPFYDITPKLIEVLDA